MRLHPLLQALTLLGVAVAAVLWLARGGAPALPPDGGATTAEAVAGDTDAAAADFVAATEPTTTAPDGDGDASPRTEVAPAPAAEVRPGPLVRVVRGEPPVPAAGVEVAWIDRDEGLARRDAQPGAAGRLGYFDLPTHFGRRARAGADGTLRLPPSPGALVITAAEAGDFAGVVARRDQREVLLHLRTDETLQLAVLDARGRGRAAVPVGVFFVGEGQNRMWGGATDEHGNAAVTHFQLVRQKPRKGERFVAAVTSPLHTPSWVEFGGRPAPNKPVTLVLPDTVAIAVTVQHRSGAPLLAPIDVQLDAIRPLDESVAALVGNGFDRQRLRKPVGDAALCFLHCERGLSLQPSLSLPGERRPRRLPPVAAPAEGDARVALVLPDDATVLALRVLDGGGGAWADARVRWELRTETGPLADGEVATETSGHGDFVLPGSARAPGALQLTLRTTDAAGTPVGCSVPVPALAPGDRRDLGELRLRPQPLVASGTVRNDRGEPIPGARVAVQTSVSDPERGERWLDAPLLRNRTGDDGTFATFGHAPPSAFRLQAEAENHFAATTQLLAAGTVADLTLVRAGILQGRVVLPDWLQPNAVRIAFQPADGAAPDPRRQRNTTLQRQNGYFWIGNLQPGLYTVSVTVRGLPEAVATIPLVRIDPGENQDQRLLPLDLSTAVFRYRLRAVGPGGPLDDFAGPILWKTSRPSGEASVATFRWSKGRAELIVPAPFVELLTLGPGFAPTSFSLGAGDHEVFLQPVTPVPVELPGLRGLAGPTRAIRVSAIFTGETGLPTGVSSEDQQSGEQFSFQRWDLGKSGGGWLDAFDRTGLQVSRGGAHELVLRLYEGDKRTGRQVSVALGTHELSIDGSGRTLVLTVDAQKVQEALASLQAQAEAPRSNRSR